MHEFVNVRVRNAAAALALALVCACASGQPGGDAPASTTTQSPLSQQDSEIFVAALDGDVARLRVLVDGGARIDFRDEFGFTPVRSAAGSNRFEAVRFLVQRGASLDIRDREETTLLQDAIVRNQWLMVELVIDLGADTNLQGIRRGKPIGTALHMILSQMHLRHERVEAAKPLVMVLNRGVDTNLKADDRYPLDHSFITQLEVVQNMLWCFGARQHSAEFEDEFAALEKRAPALDCARYKAKK